MGPSSSPRLVHAVLACALGVVGCGVAVALAGPTPWPPADPLDQLPGGLTRIADVPCATDAFNAVVPTSTEDGAPSTKPPPCWHITFVSSPDESGNQLVDRLSGLYQGRGYTFTGITSGPARSLMGTHEVCGTVLTMDTDPAAASAPPGALAASATPGASGAPVPDPAAPGGGVVTPTGPDGGIVNTPTVPAGAVPELSADAIRDAIANDPMSLFTYMSGDLRGSVVIVASHQTRAVAPRNAAGRC